MRLQQEFEAELQRFKTDLIIAVNKTDVLDNGEMKELTMLYNKRMVNLQTGFLQQIADINADKKRVEFRQMNYGESRKFDTGNLSHDLRTATLPPSIKFITWKAVQTSSWWMFGTFFTSTATLLLVIRLVGAAGISVALAMGLLTGAIVFDALAIVYFTHSPVWRRHIRNQLIRDFDKTTVPKLRNWSNDIIKLLVEVSPENWTVVCYLDDANSPSNGRIIIRPYDV
ncbi:MAG: hypothetical protein LBU65_01645 [Planctomycetaceae bacterium]|jgi:hypothetical protein|nr:hypothetical protein [Planctomycetaceae bacterium]